MAARPRDVRFIGDGKAGPKHADQPTSQKPGRKDDVFVIGEEEQVFYIGPNTKPPREAVAERLRAQWANVRRNRAAQQQARAQAARPIRQAAVQAPAPPPEPAVMPSPRIRVAETASSMLWTAPTMALLTVPALFAFSIQPNAHPDQAAFLFGTSLLGVWGALASGKLLEGRTVTKWTRRGVNLGTGALVGLLAYALTLGLDLGRLPGPNYMVYPKYASGVEIGGQMIPLGPTSPVVYAAFFGLLTMLTGSTALASRDRKRKFGIFPVLKAGAFGGLLGLLMPFPEPWGVAIGAMTAAGVQAVSPWSAQAAKYARYSAWLARKTRRQVA
jgi:hypothetical protein